MKISQSNFLNLYNFSQIENKKNKTKPISLQRSEKNIQLPSFSGFNVLLNRNEKKPVYVDLGATNTTGEKILIGFNKEFVKKLSEIKAQKGESLQIKDLLNPDNYIEERFLDKLPESTFDFLTSLKVNQPEKYSLVHSILQNTFLRTKTAEGVTDEYKTNFVKKLAECHDVLLRNVVENNIPIRIHDVNIAFSYKIGHAQFGQKVTLKQKDDILDRYGCLKMKADLNNQFINLMERDFNGPIIKNGIPQNTVDSLPHELAHAFDYNNGRKLNLTQQDKISVVLPSSPTKLVANNERFIDMPSFSKEFDTAIGEDIFRMFEKDKELGLKAGTTFTSILDDKDFSYYWGSDSPQERKFDDVKARRELFAQLFSYACGSSLTSQVFQERIEDIFPNGLECVKRILAEAEKL